MLRRIIMGRAEPARLAALERAAAALPSVIDGPLQLFILKALVGITKSGSVASNRRCTGMYQPSYYREQAHRARQLAEMVHQPDLKETLCRAAQDFEDIAYDLEIGAVEIRHPEMLPQRRRKR
jgi:hypothetical protein